MIQSARMAAMDNSPEYANVSPPSPRSGLRLLFTKEIHHEQRKVNATC